MTKKVQSPKNASELNLYLTQILADISNQEIEIEEANTIAKISDKINKNVLNQILYKKATSDKNINIQFLSE